MSNPNACRECPSNMQALYYSVERPYPWMDEKLMEPVERVKYIDDIGLIPYSELLIS